MKARDLRELSPEELGQQYEETRQELFNLQMQKSTGQLENPARVRLLRRDVARLKTVLREREQATT